MRVYLLRQQSSVHSPENGCSGGGLQDGGRHPLPLIVQRGWHPGTVPRDHCLLQYFPKVLLLLPQMAAAEQGQWVGWQLQNCSLRNDHRCLRHCGIISNSSCPLGLSHKDAMLYFMFFSTRLHKHICTSRTIIRQIHLAVDGKFEESTPERSSSTPSAPDCPRKLTRPGDWHTLPIASLPFGESCECKTLKSHSHRNAPRNTIVKWIISCYAFHMVNNIQAAGMPMASSRLLRKEDSLRCASRCETRKHCQAVRPTAGDAAPDGHPHTIADQSGHRPVHHAPPISQGQPRYNQAQ